MAQQVKPEKAQRAKVVYGDSTEVQKMKGFLNELETVVKVTHLMFADECSFKMFCGLDFSNPVLIFKHRKFIKQKIESAYGCEFPDELFEQPITQGCAYLKANRKHNPVNKDVSCFLGIKNLTALETKENYGLTYPFILKDHVDYFSGWIFGKQNPLNGAKDSQDSIMKDFLSMKQSVYEKTESLRWEIKTEEGDVLRFSNLYEVCCWVIARASNYSSESMTKENW
jgi:hypothetical protein